MKNTVPFARGLLEAIWFIVYLIIVLTAAMVADVISFFVVCTGTGLLTIGFVPQAFIFVALGFGGWAALAAFLHVIRSVSYKSPLEPSDNSDEA